MVKRYNPYSSGGIYGGMKEAERGVWCKFEDAKELLEEYTVIFDLLVKDSKDTHDIDSGNPMFGGNAPYKHKDLIERVTGMTVEEVIIWRESCTKCADVA
jgi:hypothetical protein